MEIVEKEATLEKVRLLDKKTNKLLADKIVTLPYFENLEMFEIFSNYSIFIAHDLYTQLNYEGLYCVTNNMLYIDASFINIEVMLHEKIHMITSSIKDKKIGYQDDKTDETFHFSNYLNESATEWLKCKILYGENFLKNPNTQCIIAYLPGVIQFQKYVNTYGEERMLKHFFHHDFRSFWNSFSSEEKLNLFMNFETARTADKSSKNQNPNIK